MMLSRIVQSFTVGMRIAFSVMAAAVVCLTSSVEAHPFHASIAEIEWNPRSARFEVALRINQAELEDAVSAVQGARFRIEDSAEVDPKLRTYIQHNFRVTFEPSDEAEFHWLGAEAELHEIWIYFEIIPKKANPSTENSPPTGRADRWEDLFPTEKSSSRKSIVDDVLVKNRLLFDVQPAQLNLIRLKCGRQRVSSQTTAETPSVRLQLNGL
ncbi:MAG: DUF6702 family protein [Planctomycetaceae bacterium]